TQSARLDLQRTVITAPFDARIARVDIEISQYVGTGTTLGLLDGAAEAEVEVQISQRRLIALARLEAALGPHSEDSSGAAVAVQPASLNDVPRSANENQDAAGDPRRLAARVSLGSDQGSASWSAEVDRTSDSANAETRSIGVIVRILEPYAHFGKGGQPPLIKGAFVKVDLAAPRISGALMIPQSAIRNGRVMIAGSDDRLDFVPVTQLFFFDNIAVLAPGTLPAQARIITSDPSPALEGLLVSPRRDLMAEARMAAAADGDAL
ncbi:MAG: HlyD family efflux transporter periplasmic adaptor subunit, partial [Pseudomonadota bacterium]